MEWGWHGGGEAWVMSPAAYWAAVVIVAVLTGLGLALNAVVLRKAGRHWLWALLFLFPLAYVVGLWVFAFTRWPHGPEAVPGGAAPNVSEPNPRRSVSDRRRW